MPHTIHMHRVLRAKPEVVFAAFSNVDAQLKWIPPSGYFAKSHGCDFRVGGRFRMSFTHLASGHENAFGGEYLEIVPNTRLRYTDQFEDANLPGTLTVTIDFKKVSCGTEIKILQEGIPDVIPNEACMIGWQQSMAQLALLVEEFPNG